MIRTRFAPSPTGYMHVGNLRTALFSYLIAKKNNGKFILRIEDTDQKRFLNDSKDFIFKTLKQAGLKYDEGPDIGGEFGPYIQSERKEIYLYFADKLLKDKKAFYCFCKANNKDKNICRCEELDDNEINKKILSRESYVIRQKIFCGTTKFVDLIYGEITINNTELDKQILIKSDGFATYNFANVIDDHLMKITHVVRGCEYLSSTPKYNLLYNFFNWEIPKYIHLPLILNNNGEKLSKRHGSVSFEDLINQGFLPEAIINYIAFLGWSPDDNTKELFYLNELEKIFDIKKISRSPAIFDIKKITWMNGQHIKKLPEEIFLNFSRKYLESKIDDKNIDIKKLAKFSQTRINFINQAGELFDFLNKIKNYSIDLFKREKIKCDLYISNLVLKNSLEIFCIIEKEDWNEKNLKEKILKLIDKLNLKSRQVFWPIRVALSGQENSPCGAIEIAEILKKTETINRIKIAIDKINIK